MVYISKAFFFRSLFLWFGTIHIGIAHPWQHITISKMWFFYTKIQQKQHCLFRFSNINKIIYAQTIVICPNAIVFVFDAKNLAFYSTCFQCTYAYDFNYVLTNAWCIKPCLWLWNVYCYSITCFNWTRVGRSFQVSLVKGIERLFECY